ncbi:beta strand repeat-containing protein [Neptunomonas antarctica]|uniref:Hemolysin-type calcium-binding repeat-containing protein n=1 Tax=Neptunomonas antarctica TaxID=619304 RepID=A0A1N7MY76_9GAMM|nr:PD40 domain-containing protein [Neptunomonas antarctica]SIS90839.1 Hemolysin-type calcium-binding repeat-containing protein [Neptunomonas antarctica]
MSTENTINGTAAADTVTFTAASTTVNAGEGANTITGTSGNNVISAGDGADTITVTSGNNTINAGAGANTIVATSGINEITTGDGADTITTGGLAGGGNTINAGGGANTITTGAGDDTVTGGSGVDTVTTGAGDDVVHAGNGANTITTGAGSDTVYSGVDIDTITTGAGDDTIHILGGTDTIAAGADNDTLIANLSLATSAVSLNALAGTAATGYAGNLSGLGIATFAGVENFEITSGDFNDTITTGDGTDVVHAGAGDDTINLAGGADEAIYTMADNAGATDVYQGGAGVDTLTLEFTAAEWLSAGVQADIARYQVFLADQAGNASGEADSAVFQFQAFGLDASEFEALSVIVDGVELDPSDYAPSNYVFALDDIEPSAQTVDTSGTAYSKPSISSDGGTVAFLSDATDLVPNDTNGDRDLFVTDVETGTVTLVSKTAAGVQLNGYFGEAAVSGNGRVVAFSSSDSTAIPGDNNGSYGQDVFVKNLDTGVLTRVSESSTGGSGNQNSNDVSISDDGTKVGFNSRASDLVSNDLNNVVDVFVRDMATGDLVRASTSSTGVEGNGHSNDGIVSGNGEWAAFTSQATNFDVNDINGRADVYVKNLGTGAITVASTTQAGEFGNHNTWVHDISADGRYLVMGSYADNLVADSYNGNNQVFRKDMLTGEILHVSTDSDGVKFDANSPKISDDGQFIVFTSSSSNLSSDPEANYGRVYIKDVLSGSLLMISEDVPSGQYVGDLSISSDGNTVTYNVYDYYEVQPSTVKVVDVASLIANQGLATDFDQVAIDVTAPGTGQDIQIDWGNGETSDVVGTTAGDVYRLRGEYDSGVTTVASVTVTEGATVVSEELINVQTAGRDDPMQKLDTDADGNTPSYSVSYNPSVSGDGNLVAFSNDDYYGVGLLSESPYQSMVYVKDRQTGEVELVSRDANGVIANSYSYGPSISANGASVGFNSYANNLVLDDTNGTEDVFVKNLETGAIELVSKATDGTLGNGSSNGVTLSADGTKAAFSSRSSNLTANDTDTTSDLFVHDLTTGITELVSVNLSGVSGGTGYSSQISDDGTHVAFASHASDLVAGDTEGQTDVFVRDLTTGVTTRVSEVAGVGGNSFSEEVSLSADGNIVVFTSYATNFGGSGSGQIYAKDMTTGVITTVSESASGVASNDYTGGAEVTADGRFVTFASDASNLIDGVTDADGGDSDIFVKDLQTGDIIQIDDPDYYSNYPDNSYPSISDDGSFVAFALSGYYESSLWGADLSPPGSSLTGTNDADILIGHNGPDVLVGLAGDDRLSGGVGEDLINGGAGDDILSGGENADTFFFKVGSGNDVISDFEQGVDIIDVSGYGFVDFNALTIDVGTEASVIDFGAGDTVSVVGVASLDSSDFIFA